MFKCDICDKEFKHQGSLNLHKYKKHNIASNKDKDNNSNSNVCKKCNTKLRPLQADDTLENKAILDGHDLVCENCCELY